MEHQEYQIVSYYGKTAVADDKVWDGTQWSDFWRQAASFSKNEAEKLSKTLTSHKATGHVGIQKYYPW